MEIPPDRNRIDDAILVSLAGSYAQRRHDPSSKWRRGKDLKEVSDLILLPASPLPVGQGQGDFVVLAVHQHHHG